MLGDETVVRDLTAADVDRYVSTRIDEGAHTNTVAKELAALRGILKLAHRHGLCDHPSSVMPLDFSAKYEPRKAHVAGLSDLRKLVAALPARRRAHVLFCVAFGASWGESERAEPGDIDVDRGFVHVRGTKNRHRDRLVPILYPDLATRVLREAPGKRVLFAPWSNVRRDLHVACKRAKLPMLSPNDLRRTFGTWLRAQGVEPQLIGAAMGHADSRMVERVYGRLTPEALRDLLIARAPTGVRVAGGPTGILGLSGRAVPAGSRAQGQNRTVDTRIFKPRGLVAIAGGLGSKRPEGAPKRLRVYGLPDTFGELIAEALAVGAP